jgi:hypothetical protein
MLSKLNTEFDDRWGILAVADETNRREEWPVYRAKLERMIRAGNPPEFFVESMPWKSVITMAVEDTKFWDTHFVKPCERNARKDQAAVAAARARSGYTPAMICDGYEEMMNGAHANGVQGPYEGRTPRGAQAHPGALAQAPWAPWGLPQAPEAWPEQIARHEDGRRKICPHSKTPFCFAYGAGQCADQRCSRAHGCEFCGGFKHITQNCHLAPPGFTHPWWATKAGKALSTKGAPKGGKDGKAQHTFIPKGGKKGGGKHGGKKGGNKGGGKKGKDGSLF